MEKERRLILAKSAEAVHRQVTSRKRTDYDREQSCV